MRNNIKSYDYARTNFKDINKQIANIALTKYKEGLNKQQQMLQGVTSISNDDNDVTSTDPIVNIKTAKKPVYTQSSIITATPKVSINQSSLVSEFLTESRYLNEEVMVIMNDLNIQSTSEFYGGTEDNDDLNQQHETLDEMLNNFQELSQQLSNNLSNQEKYDVLSDILNKLVDIKDALEKKENKSEDENKMLHAIPDIYNDYNAIYKQLENEINIVDDNDDLDQQSQNLTEANDKYNNLINVQLNNATTDEEKRAVLYDIVRNADDIIKRLKDKSNLSNGEQQYLNLVEEERNDYMEEYKELNIKINNKTNSDQNKKPELKIDTLKREYETLKKDFNKATTDTEKIAALEKIIEQKKKIIRSLTQLPQKKRSEIQKRT